MDNTSSTTTKKLPLQEKPLGFFFFIVISCIIAFMMFVVILLSVTSLARVNQDSMLPTLVDRSHSLLLDNPNRVRRGDIVVVEAPEHYHTAAIFLFVKRVVATEGDTVRFILSDSFYSASGQTDRIVYFYLKPYGSSEFVRQYEDDIILETMIFGTRFAGIRSRFQNGVFTYTVPENSIYILGDNRNNSVDSRQYGSFKLDSVRGRVIYSFGRNSLAERIFLFLF